MRGGGEGGVSVEGGGGVVCGGWVCRMQMPVQELRFYLSKNGIQLTVGAH